MRRFKSLVSLLRGCPDGNFLTGFTPLQPEHPTLPGEAEVKVQTSHYKPSSLSQVVTGFTLIEILVTLAVLVILGTTVLSAFSRFRASTELDAAVHQALSVIRLAQSKTLAAEEDSQHGVRFESDRITLFQGASFTEVPTNEVIELSALVQITNISLAGGGVDVVFTRLSGRTPQSGFVTLALASDPSRTRVITIDSSGQARAEAALLLPGGTRIVDTRHVNFELGWSIESAITLRLQFPNPPNPDTIQDIAMADYFNAGHTIFDWQGTVDIGGSSQTLRIHTLSLSPLGTTLSVHRDRRTNNKAVIILIDGKEISRYDAEGNVTAGPFGGTMTIQ